MKNLQTFEEFLNESVVNEADMTKFYDGFVMYDSKNKKEYKADQVEAVATYYEVSKHEDKEYIDMLSKEELENLVNQINGQ